MNLEKKFLSKDDKIELSGKIDGLEIRLTSRMDSHFKWLLGILLTAMFALFGGAITLFKLMH